MFFHPFTSIIFGSTGSGKTQFLQRFLKHSKELIENCPSKIMYAYGALNSKILEMQRDLENIVLYEGIPSEEDIKQNRDEKGGLLLVFDDLAFNLNSDYLDILFSKGSHNWGVSVILVTQNLFLKQIKTARNNTHVIILIKSPAAAMQAKNLAIQIFSGKLKFFMEVFDDVMKNDYAYLVIDNHPKTAENQRLKTYIYPQEQTIYYVPI